MTYDTLTKLGYFKLRDQVEGCESFGKLDIDSILFVITINETRVAAGKIELLNNSILNQQKIDNIQIAYNRLQNDLKVLNGGNNKWTN